MKLKKALLVTCFSIIMLFLLAGCNPKEGQTLLNALNKQSDIKSFDGKIEMSLNVNPQIRNLSSDNLFAYNIVNNTVATIEEKQDLTNGKQFVNTTIDFGGVTVNVPVYYDGKEMLIKPPFERKYVKVSSDDFAEINSGLGNSTINTIDPNKQKELQQKMQTLINKFFTAYALEHTDAFKNITSKGTQTIDTPEGSKQVSVIEIKFNDKDFKDFIISTLKDASNSNSLKDFARSLVDFLPEIISSSGLANDPSMYNFMNNLDAVRSDFDDNYSLFIGALKENLPQIEQSLNNYFEVGPNGLALTYYIDNQGYIIKTNAIIDSIIKQPSYENEQQNDKIEFTFNLNSQIYNINKTVVSKPIDDETNVIPVKEYVKNNPIWKNSPIADALGVSPIYAEINLESGDASINYSPYEFSTDPYMKDGSYMVPFDFVAKILRLDVKIDPQTNEITFSDGTKAVKLSPNSNYALVNNNRKLLSVKPEIINGNYMVPLRFVAEQFGATVNWEDYSWDDSDGVHHPYTYISITKD